jgi:hypothetical protein
MTFGCIIYIWNMMLHPKKLEKCGHKMIFMSDESDSKAYRTYNPVTNHIHVWHEMWCSTSRPSAIGALTASMASRP